MAQLIHALLRSMYTSGVFLPCMISDHQQVVSTQRSQCHLDKHRQLGDAIHPLHKVPGQAVIHVVVEDGDGTRSTQLVMRLT